MKVLGARIVEETSYANSDDGEIIPRLMSYGCSCCESDYEMTVENIEAAIAYHKEEILTLSVELGVVKLKIQQNQE